MPPQSISHDRIGKVGGRDSDSSGKPKKTESQDNVNKCSTIKEGFMVNVDVTAPGLCVFVYLPSV